MRSLGQILVFLAAANVASLLTAQTLSVPRPEDVRGSALAEAARQGDRATVDALLKQGLDVNGWTADGTPALHWAVRVNDRELVETLLAAGADVNATNRYGQAPLHVAVEHRHAAMVERLLDAGADVDVPDGAGEPALLIATHTGDRALVDLLLARGAGVDVRDEHYGQTALMLAVREGHAALVERFLAAGADINAQNYAGEEHERVLPSDVPVGTSQGVGINRSGLPDRGMRYPITGSMTPLLYATRAGNLALTKLLVEAGADIEKADANGITPLMNAILNYSIVSVRRTPPSEHFAVAHYLIEQGANVNAQDWYGQTPLWIAVDIRNMEMRVTDTTNYVDRDAAFEMIEALIDAGADVNPRTKEFPPEKRFIAGTGFNGWADMTGQTPFLRASIAGDLRVMRLLLDHGADPLIATADGTTPLMVAAGISWAFAETYDEGADALLEAVKLTHALGNDIEAVNTMGLRAIHGAANRGSNDIIRYLAEQGAALGVRDNEGRSPIDWAEGELTGARAPTRKPETIELLQQLQAAREQGAQAAE
ncbi:MAG: ankyrin repeat domain-containing protein [Gammaproteobacteria bacterium]